MISMMNLAITVCYKHWHILTSCAPQYRRMLWYHPGFQSVIMQLLTQFLDDQAEYSIFHCWFTWWCYFDWIQLWQFYGELLTWQSFPVPSNYFSTSVLCENGINTKHCRGIEVIEHWTVKRINFICVLLNLCSCHIELSCESWTIASLP